MTNDDSVIERPVDIRQTRLGCIVSVRAGVACLLCGGHRSMILTTFICVTCSFESQWALERWARVRQGNNRCLTDFAKLLNAVTCGWKFYWFFCLLEIALCFQEDLIAIIVPLPVLLQLRPRWCVCGKALWYSYDKVSDYVVKCRVSSSCKLVTIIVNHFYCVISIRHSEVCDVDKKTMFAR